MRSTIIKLVVVGSALVIGACASLPQREATAFKTIAKADSDTFSKSIATDTSSRGEAAVIQLSNSGIGITTANCIGDVLQDAVCQVRLTGTGVPTQLSLVDAAAKTRKLMAAVSGYGSAMADLAEAKDVAAAKANVDAAGKSIETLATLTGVGAPAAGIVKAATALAKGRLTAARRKALLEAAIAADPAIQTASQNLGLIAAQVKGNILDSTRIGLNRCQLAFDRATATGQQLQGQYDALPKGAAGANERERMRVLIDQEQSRRVDAGNSILRTANDIRLARGMQTDFGGLGKAHTALIAALRDKKLGLGDAFEGINAFLDAASSAKGD